MDVDLFAFASFANHAQGYYTPTPDGVNILCHNQAVDLLVIGMGMNIDAPLAIPASGRPLFPPQLLLPQQFQTPFALPQPAFRPNTILRYNAGCEAMEQPGNRSPLQAVNMHVSPALGSLPIGSFSTSPEENIPAQPIRQNDK